MSSDLGRKIVGRILLLGGEVGEGLPLLDLDRRSNIQGYEILASFRMFFPLFLKMRFLPSTCILGGEFCGMAAVKISGKGGRAKVN